MTEQADGGDHLRLRLDVAYDGGGFSGWASQPGLRTVQGTIEDAVAKVLRLPAEGPGCVRLTVAGRTDAGVHARGQVCHFDLDRLDRLDRLHRLDGLDDTDRLDVEPALLGRRLHRVLPADVVVRRVSRAPEGFDARFSALWRRYAYRVCDNPATMDPLRRHDVVGWPRVLDESAMNTAACKLLGEHDFSAFCKRREGATTVRRLRELSWTRTDGVLVCRVVADAFCHTMVRCLVGCLVAVGEDRRSVTWPTEVLAAGVRDPRVQVVAAHGLTLEEVRYPPDAELAVRARATRATRTVDHGTAP